MKLFKKNNTRAILHVNRHEATLLSLETGKKTSFSFTDDILQNLEIVNSKSLNQRIGVLKEKSDIKSGRVVLVLSEDFLFSKSLSADHPEDLKREINAFVSTIPFEKEKIVYNTFKFGGNTLVIATNKSFFSTIQELCRAYGWEICYVVPETIFSLLGEGKSTHTFNIKEADRFLYENTTLIKKLNFSDCSKIQQSGLNKLTAFISERKFYFIGLLVLLLLAGGGFAYYKIYGLSLPQFQKEQQNAESPANETPESTESQESTQSVDTDSTSDTETPIELPDESTGEDSEIPLSEIDRSKFTFNILNGAGAAGLASSTEELLVENGFLEENIEVGNTEIVEVTTLTYNNVYEVLVEETVRILETVFTEVKTVKDEDLSRYDMQVDLGQNLIQE